MRAQPSKTVLRNIKTESNRLSYPHYSQHEIIHKSITINFITAYISGDIKFHDMFLNIYLFKYSYSIFFVESKDSERDRRDIRRK